MQTLFKIFDGIYIGTLEDLRDEALTKIISRFQAFVRGYLMRKNYKKLQDQRIALSIIQRNIRKWLLLRLASAKGCSL